MFALIYCIERFVCRAWQFQFSYALKLNWFLSGVQSMKWIQKKISYFLCHHFNGKNENIIIFKYWFGLSSILALTPTHTKNPLNRFLFLIISRRRKYNRCTAGLINSNSANLWPSFLFYVDKTHRSQIWIVKLISVVRFRYSSSLFIVSQYIARVDKCASNEHSWMISNCTNVELKVWKNTVENYVIWFDLKSIEKKMYYEIH